jgi:hypothetical protein
LVAAFTVESQAYFNHQHLRWNALVAFANFFPNVGYILVALREMFSCSADE